VVQHLHILAFALFIGEDDRLGRGIIPTFAGCFLIMPQIFAGLRLQRDDRGQEQIVAFAVRADAMVPWIAIADAQIELVEFMS
jgi:hypothetical protein